MRLSIGRTLLISALVALAVPASAPAAFPGQNGRIAFSSNRGGDFAIWTMAADGTDARQVTAPTPRLIDRSPTWSPDGRRIAFERGPGSSSQVWVVDADGSGATQLTSAPGHNAMPTWSPNGTKIAFASSRTFGNFNIWVMNADGTDQHAITSDAGIEEFPAWSPAGDQILFTAQFDSPYVLWTTTPDGTTLAPFGHADGSAATDWSPDASSVVADGSRIVLVRPGGGAPTPLLPGGNFYPAWSPDGSRIVYTHGYTNKDIWTAKPDGSDQRPVAEVPGDDDQPDWQPVPNRPPDCSNVSATPPSLWPPNRKLRRVMLSGATDPDGDTVTLSVTGVTGGDARDVLLGPRPDQVRLRAVRGRTYGVAFHATDGRGAECSGAATVTVQHER